MRLPDHAHTSQPWRIHQLAPDFRVEDVWALPTPGGPHDLSRLVRLVASGDNAVRSSLATRLLWAIRLRAGQLLGWDRPDASAPTLAARLPADLRASGPGPKLRGLPFTSLYLLPDEWAAEISNRTMHGILHLGWVRDPATGGYRGQMAILVKPNGLLGRAYMAAIAPFRHLVVYPQWIRTIGRAWHRVGNVGLVAFHYPRPEYAEEMLRRVRQAVKAIKAAPGCLGADCWLTDDGIAIVTTGQWESRRALNAGFAAARAAGLDFSYSKHEAWPREIHHLERA
jgi:quinol monooxygenase YgiN